jgi:signal transduction histidine kinase
VPVPAETPVEAARGILELVDQFREFGHSGVATRNLDRLLRCCRNLYDDNGVDEEIRRRLLEAREVFLGSTLQTLESLLDSFESLPSRENPVAPAQLAQVRERVQRLGSLIKDLEDPPGRSSLEELELNLAALEKQLGRLEKAVDRQVAANPVKVLDGLLIQLRDELGGVALTLTIPQELRGMLIRLPVPRLQFILENLISNALYWMREREQPRLHIELRERPTLLQILVRDNGPGIPQDQWERIFDPGNSGRPAEEKGGYGLFRSREILARFGGRLVVNDSTPGEGSCFLLEAKKVEPEA